jgi:hypothetical protein
MSNFNPLATQLFIAALRQEDVGAANLFAVDVTNNPDLVNSSIPPTSDLSDEELADFLEFHLNELNKGIVNLSWNVHIPSIIGAVAAWLEKQYSENNNGKTDSEHSV